MDACAHEFSCGSYSQTPGEHRQDRDRLKRLKRKIENAIPRSALCIDDATEWNTHWRIPLAVSSRNVREEYFTVVRGYGARLEVQETVGEDQALFSYFVSIPKARHWLRAWSSLEKGAAIISSLVFTGSLAALGYYVFSLYQTVG